MSALSVNVVAHTVSASACGHINRIVNREVKLVLGQKKSQRLLLVPVDHGRHMGDLAVLCLEYHGHITCQLYS